MSARVVAILLGTNLLTALVSIILAWFLEPLRAALVRWWQARDLRKHRGDLFLWELDMRSKEDADE